MVEGEDWIMRPVMRGMCKFESLVDGTLDLSHLALMNEALDIEAENSARESDAIKAKQK